MRIHLMQASSAHSLSDPQARSDFMVNLGSRADVVSFTEVHERHDVLADCCDLMGYQLILPDEGDVALAVLRTHTLIVSGSVASVPAQGHGGGHPAHTARPVLWAGFRPHGTREAVTVHGAHWVTRRADTGHQQLELTEDLARVVRSHAQGRRLGFWMGDTNSPDVRADRTPVDRALRKGQLTSCWDELDRWPPTYRNATLDVIGSYDPDGRVSCDRARVLRPTHSDHRAVSAWYTVLPVGGR